MKTSTPNLFRTSQIHLPLFIIDGPKILLINDQLLVGQVEQEESIEQCIERTLITHTSLKPTEIRQGSWQLSDQVNLLCAVTQFEGSCPNGTWHHYLELPSSLHHYITPQFLKWMAQLTTTKEIAYLASPLASDDPKVREERIYNATKLAGKLLEEGIFVFSPLTHNVPIDAMTQGSGWDKWKLYDLSALLLCDKMILYKQSGWENSVGVRDEIAFAKEHHIPIIEIDADERT